MEDGFHVSKTVSLKLAQVKWLVERFGNVTRGVQALIQEKINVKDEDNEDEQGNQVQN